jgi:hypothetical protein
MHTGQHQKPHHREWHVRLQRIQQVRITQPLRADQQQLDASVLRVQAYCRYEREHGGQNGVGQHPSYQQACGL